MAAVVEEEGVDMTMAGAVAAVDILVVVADTPVVEVDMTMAGVAAVADIQAAVAEADMTEAVAAEDMIAVASDQPTLSSTVLFFNTFILPQLLTS